MKKIIIFVATILSLTILCTGCFRETAKGKNAKIDYTAEAYVGCYPVCPECNHISPECYFNISDGEYGESSYVCEKCYEVYTITIDRR